MISVDEARQLIRMHTEVSEKLTVELCNSVGYALANDIHSPINFPSYRQSAMDGYAFRFDDLKVNQTLEVVNEIQAGATTSYDILKQGEAVRIYTGARVPHDADTVVMQEHVERNGNQIRITHSQLVQGSHIRPVASQTSKGDMIMQRGSMVTPGAAALIASVGITQIEVFQKPTCVILNTGKELINPGNPIVDGQIYESNSFALRNGLKELQIDVAEIIVVDDDPTLLKNAIQVALQKADILLITGGVSVGDYDFVSEALDQNGVTKIFHRVKQKPGKPLYFGKQHDKIVFGLPGNPGSVLTCFYEYVIPCIRKKLGFNEMDLSQFQLPLKQAYSKKSGLTHFLKGKIIAHEVEVLDHQESYKMNGFAMANCLVQIDETCEDLAAGTMVNVHLLNNSMYV